MPAGTILLPWGGITGNKIIVQTISLEQFLNDNNINKIDFLKIDCEEAEYEILFNFNLLSMVRKISMEKHDVDKNWNSVKLKSFLEKNGFKCLIKGYMLYAIK